MVLKMMYCVMMNVIVVMKILGECVASTNFILHCHFWGISEFELQMLIKASVEEEVWGGQA
jgi:hypothetical protein